MNILLSRDIVQMVSQYSPEVYCQLRLVNSAVKEMVDEVLPKGSSNRKVDSWDHWTVNFLKNAHWCGFKLMDQKDFDGWIVAVAFASDYGVGGPSPHDVFVARDKVEKFCRDYLPKKGLLTKDVLDLLCVCDRKEYVRELWNKAVDKEERFYLDCIEEISMLDDLEFVKIVHEYFKNTMSLEIVRKAIKNSILVRRWTHVSFLVEEYPKVKDDQNEIFQHAVTHWDLFQKVTHTNDKETVKEAVKQNGQIIQFAHESFRKDKEIVMTAVKQAGQSLMYADKSLCNDKDVVMAAVSQFGFALRFASDSLRKDKEVVLAAVRECGDVISLLDDSLRDDKDVIIEAVKQDPMIIQYFEESIRNDKDILMEAVKRDGIMLGACISLRDDKDIVMEAVKQNGLSLQYADESLCSDKEIVTAAVKQNQLALEHADESLQYDEEFLMSLGISAVLDDLGEYY